MIDLKPCPFCGGKVDFMYNAELLPSGIHCVRCHMLAGFYRVKPPKPHEPYERALSEYAEAWNARARK